MTQPASKPPERPLHTFLQLGGLAAVILGLGLNAVGLISMGFARADHPPKLLVLSIIGLPLIVAGIVMMTIGFTAAARAIRRFQEKQGEQV